MPAPGLDGDDPSTIGRHAALQALRSSGAREAEQACLGSSREGKDRDRVGWRRKDRIDGRKAVRDQAKADAARGEPCLGTQ
jgi:hypothetical protein